MTASPEPQAERAALTEHDWGTKPWKAPFLQVLAHTRNASAAARAVGRSREYVMRERQSDPEFAEAWKEAKDVGADLLEQVAWRRATVGEPRRVTTVTTHRDSRGRVVSSQEVVQESTRVSDQLLRDQLRAARPEVYGDKVAHVGHDGGPVQVEVGPRERTVDRLAALYDIAVEAGLIGPVVEVPSDDG